MRVSSCMLPRFTGGHRGRWIGPGPGRTRIGAIKAPRMERAPRGETIPVGAPAVRIPRMIPGKPAVPAGRLPMNFLLRLNEERDCTYCPDGSRAGPSGRCVSCPNRSPRRRRPLGRWIRPGPGRARHGGNQSPGNACPYVSGARGPGLPPGPSLPNLSPRIGARQRIVPRCCFASSRPGPTPAGPATSPGPEAMDRAGNDSCDGRGDGRPPKPRLPSWQRGDPCPYPARCPRA